MCKKTPAVRHSRGFENYFNLRFALFLAALAAQHEGEAAKAEECR